MSLPQLLVALAAAIAVGAAVLPIEEKFIPAGEPKTYILMRTRNVLENALKF